MSSTSHRLVIVGAGPAGIAAAVESARLGVEPLLLESRRRAGGTIRLAHEVRNLPFAGEGISGARVARGLRALLDRWEIVLQHEQVVRIEQVQATGSFELTCKSGRTLRAAALCLALGAEPLRPGWEGIGRLRPGLVVASARAACAPSTGVAFRFAVVGGGDVAWDQARWLTHRGYEVELFSRSTRPRAPSWLVDAALSDGVLWSPGLEPLRLQAQGSGLLIALQHRTSPGKTEKTEHFDRLIYAIGREPCGVPGPLDLRDAPPPNLRLAGDILGGKARHVLCAMGDGTRAACELLNSRPSPTQPIERDLPS